jgi:copper chaperone
MSETIAYTVPGMTCDPCNASVTRELTAVQGVAAVEIDLEAKLVTVSGNGLDDSTLREAIDDAGYEAA